MVLTTAILLLFILNCVIPSPVKKDAEKVSFQFNPKYNNIKDYVDILNLTVRLLNRHYGHALHHSTKKIKDAIKTTLTKPKRDCKELYDNGFRKNGVYEISPTHATSFDAYCDMKNGGWTVIQRRLYGDVSFDRNWATYAEGFGNLKGDHWLGLKKIHELTKDSPSQISFRLLMASNHALAKSLYNGFYVDDETAKFRMHVKPNAVYNREMKKYVNNDNFFYYSNNMKFSTKDSDNDAFPKRNCAHWHGAFWNKGCCRIDPNIPNFSNIQIWGSGTFKVSRTEIKIRRQ